MLEQLAIGSLVVSLTIIVESVFIGLGVSVSMRFGAWLVQRQHEFRTALALVVATLWLMLAHIIGVWIWAATFLILGIFSSLEPALYFSIVSFTTLGFGDIIITEQWRLLSGIAAANGLLLFGLSTAFLADFLGKIRRAQSDRRGY